MLSFASPNWLINCSIVFPFQSDISLSIDSILSFKQLIEFSIFNCVSDFILSISSLISEENKTLILELSDQASSKYSIRLSSLSLNSLLSLLTLLKSSSNFFISSLNRFSMLSFLPDTKAILSLIEDNLFSKSSLSFNMVLSSSADLFKESSSLDFTVFI